MSEYRQTTTKTGSTGTKQSSVGSGGYKQTTTKGNTGTKQASISGAREGFHQCTSSLKTGTKS